MLFVAKRKENERKKERKVNKQGKYKIKAIESPRPTYAKNLG